MKKLCPICKKEKPTVRIRIIGSRKVKDPRFEAEQLVHDRAVMCDECLVDFRRGKFVLKNKNEEIITSS